MKESERKREGKSKKEKGKTERQNTLKRKKEREESIIRKKVRCTRSNGKNKEVRTQDAGKQGRTDWEREPRNLGSKTMK